MISNPIHRHTSLEEGLSKIEQKARDRLLLLEFKIEISKKSFKSLDEIPNQYFPIKDGGYLGITNLICLDDNSTASKTSKVVICESGHELLNSPMYKVLSNFVKYF